MKIRAHANKHVHGHLKHEQQENKVKGKLFHGRKITRKEPRAQGKIDKNLIAKAKPEANFAKLPKALNIKNHAAEAKIHKHESHIIPAYAKMEQLVRKIKFFVINLLKNIKALAFPFAPADKSPGHAKAPKAPAHAKAPKAPAHAKAPKALAHAKAEAPAIVPVPAKPPHPTAKHTAIAAKPHTAAAPASDKDLAKKSAQAMKDENISLEPSNAMVKKEHAEEIAGFVKAFLHPYISGEITPENEPKNRKSLESLLAEKFGDDPKIKKFALADYLEASALGLYINLKLGANTELKPDSPEFKLLIDALGPAIRKDFPSLKLSKEDLIKKSGEALTNVNKMRKDLFKSVAAENKSFMPQQSVKGGKSKEQVLRELNAQMAAGGSAFIGDQKPKSKS